MSIHIKAIARFAALTGNIDQLPHDEQMQAMADREQFGEVYMPKSECSFDRAGLVLRFMQEVCGIPLWQARECAIVIIQQNGAFRFEKVVPLPGVLAARIINETDNVLIAEATAALYVSATEGTRWNRYWQDVLNAIRWGVFVDAEDASQADEK